MRHGNPFPFENMSEQADLEHVLSCMLLAMATATGADMQTLGTVLRSCADAPQLDDATRQLLMQLAQQPLACGRVFGSAT